MYAILEGIPGQRGLFRVEIDGRPLLLVRLGESVGQSLLHSHSCNVRGVQLLRESRQRAAYACAVYSPTLPAPQ